LATAWLSFGKYTTVVNSVLMLLFLCVRLSLEKRVAALTLDQVSIFNQAFAISYFVTLISVILRGLNNQNKDIQSFSILFAMSLLLPFSPDLLPTMRTTLDYSMIVAAIGVTLLLPLKHKLIEDSIIRVVIGVIITTVAAIAFSTVSLSRVSYL